MGGARAGGEEVAFSVKGKAPNESSKLPFGSGAGAESTGAEVVAKESG